MADAGMPNWVEVLAKELASYDAEARHDAREQLWWISVPLDFEAALEIECQDTNEYNVLARAWDRSHGLSDETLLASCATPHVAAYVVAGVVAQHDESVRQLAAILDAYGGEEYEDAR